MALTEVSIMVLNFLSFIFLLVAMFSLSNIKRFESNSMKPAISAFVFGLFILAVSSAFWGIEYLNKAVLIFEPSILGLISTIVNVGLITLAAVCFLGAAIIAFTNTNGVK